LTLPAKNKIKKRRAPGFKYIDACQGEIASSFFTEREKNRYTHTKVGSPVHTLRHTKDLPPLLF